MTRRILFIAVFMSAIISVGAQNQIDSRIREYISPVRIVWQQNGNGKLITSAESLLKPGNGQTVLVNNNICRMKSTETEHPAILLDFGKELQGGIQIVAGMPRSHRPINVRIRFGESVSEAMCDIDGKNGATNDHSMRDFKMSIPWLGVAEIGNSGFRFVRLDLLDDTCDLQLKEVRAIYIHRDIPFKGSFKCNDELLNRIWQTGAYTVLLNMQEYLWDGIKRDRLVWIGDMHPEVMAINTVFGYNEVVPKSLDLIRDNTPLPDWMNGIGSYSIQWLIIQHDWYLYQGDLKYLNQQKSYITQLLHLLISKIDSEGHEKLNGGRFIDWPSSANVPAVNVGLQALMIRAMNIGESLCNTLGEDSLAQECHQMAIKLTKGSSDAIKKMKQSKIAPDAPGSKQAAALMSLNGLMKPEDANKQYLTVGGVRGFSTFYGYYMLQAMAKAGDYNDALNSIRQYWGAMLNLGATTFWEDFNIDWIPNAARIDELVPSGKKDIHGDFGAYCYKGFRHSLCHGWASGPTSWLSQFVLGVEVLEPGCKKVRIVPHLGDLKWVEGTFPTPYGIIKIRHELQQDGTIKSDIDAPSTIEVIRK